MVNIIVKYICVHVSRYKTYMTTYWGGDLEVQPGKSTNIALSNQMQVIPNTDKNNNSPFIVTEI